MARSSTSRDISFPTDFGNAHIRWDGTRALLYLDEVESSSVDTADPTYLEFEYMQHMNVALECALPSPAPVRALHVGGAACALACAWAALRPRSRQVAVEVDRALGEAVRSYFPIPRSPEVKIRIADGREVLDTAREGSYDVIVRDAFASGITPPHLRTLECAAQARRSLTPTGLYLLNCAHGGAANAREDLAALLDVFPFVVTIQDPKVGRSGRRGNVVAIACAEDVLDIDEADRALRTLPLPARISRPADVRRWVAGARPLTDAAVGFESGSAPASSHS